MRKGTHHSIETRAKIKRATRKAMRRPEVRKKSLKGSFKKGVSPWNKGKKGFDPSPETHFDSSIVGEVHPSWKGGVQKSKNDCVYLWDGANKRKRRPRAIYEEHYGVLPKGFVIYHLNGNKHDDSLGNLDAISRAELLRRNNADGFDRILK